MSVTDVEYLQEKNKSFEKIMNTFSILNNIDKKALEDMIDKRIHELN